MLRIPPPSSQTLACLARLKQLHRDGANPSALREAMSGPDCSLTHQYQSAVMAYAQQNAHSINVDSRLIEVMSILGRLQRGDLAYQHIDQLSEICSQQNSISRGQLDVLLFNLALLCQKHGLDAKAQQLLPQITSLSLQAQNIKSSLTIKDSLAGTGSQKMQGKVPDLMKERFEKIVTVQSNYQWFLKVQRISLNELYNIGLSLKKRGQMRKSIELFQKVENDAPADSKLLVLSAINIAQCLYLLGKCNEATGILNKLIESENLYIRPYLQELRTKMSIWKKTEELVELSSNLDRNTKNQTQKIIYAHEEPKCLLKTSKLLYLHRKEKELAMIDCKPKQAAAMLKTQPSSSLCLKLYEGSHQRNTKRASKPRLTQVPIKQPENVAQNKNSTITMRSRSPRIRIEEMMPLQESSTIVKGNSMLEESMSSDLSQSNKVDNQKMYDHFWNVIKTSKSQEEICSAYLKLGDLYGQQNDTEKALTMYKKAKEKGDLSVYRKIGDLHYEKNPVLAIQNYQNYLRFVGSDKTIEFRLLHCYSKNKEDYKKAAHELKQILDRDPNDGQAHLLLATTLMKQGQIAKAITLCEEFKNKNYLCFENHYTLGLLYKAHNKPELAFQSFVATLRVNPTHISSLIQITELSETSNFYPELIEIYKKALGLGREVHSILQVLKALTLHETVQEKNIKPSLNFSELISLGDFFLQKELYEEAEAAYKEAQKYTSNSLLKERMGNLHYFQQKYPEAEELFRESQKRKPILKVQVKLGHSLLKQRKFAQALEIFQECAGKERENRPIYLNLMGQCLYGLGEYREAELKFGESTSLGYDKKANFYWETACRRKLMDNARRQDLTHSEA